MPSRTIAIRGVHGCSRALETLLGAIKPGPEDVIVALRDYINRGPDSRVICGSFLSYCRMRQSGSATDRTRMTDETNQNSISSFLSVFQPCLIRG
jgi:hypothetical protein